MTQEEKEKYVVKVCPFCGQMPIVDLNTETVHCNTLDCAIHRFYIHMDEWNKRYNEK